MSVDVCPECNGQGFPNDPCPLCGMAPESAVSEDESLKRLTAMNENFKRSFGKTVHYAWVRIGLWEGPVVVGRNHITQFYGDRISPIPKEMVTLQRLSTKGIAFDIEACKIVKAVSELFDVTDMSELDSADFVDKASEIFELVLQSREAVSNL